MNVVTCAISDALRTDFQGSEGNAKAAPAMGATRVRDPTVADAGSYVGVVPLAVAANLGSFSIRASSVYTQLVPSAQTETPLVDLKPNGEQVVLSASGGPVTLTTTVALNTSHTISVGQAIMPNTLKMSTGSLTLIDDGGLLSAAGSAVGAVDYANGLISITDPAVSYTVYDENELTIEGQISTRRLSVSYKPRIDPIVTVHDNGAGGFQTRPECAGMIDYATGTLSFKPDTVIALPKPNWTKVVIGTQVIDNAWYTGTRATEKRSSMASSIRPSGPSCPLGCPRTSRSLTAPAPQATPTPRCFFLCCQSI
ncbi:MAG: hypothetical protein IPN53_18290 [Comamonadaceae bacterium]|nr:hypothetical protein [Comamonadaceae bacterium]